MNGVYGYFYPDNDGYYTDVFFMTMCVDENRIYAPAGLREASYAFRDTQMNMRELPVYGAFSSLGFFVWAELFILVFTLVYKRGKGLLVCHVPAVMTILICVASPVNNTMRYGLPVMFLAPVLFCLCFARGPAGERDAGDGEREGAGPAACQPGADAVY